MAEPSGSDPRTSGAPGFSPPCGDVSGWVDGDVVRASGIPYAGAGRFAPPRPAGTWEGTYAATEWSPQCPQLPSDTLETLLGYRSDARRTDENCQYLSVTMPNTATPGDQLPVMVWFHGGSYVSGSGDMPIMDPAALVAEQHVIVVTVTYRLGLFGFLGGSGRPPNLGLLDQMEALRWVQRNIGAFGGDPAQVTVFGQSAGGDAVAKLMATADASSLFTRAIIQSAPFGIDRGRGSMNEAMYKVASTVEEDSTVDEVLGIQDDVSDAGAGFGMRSGMPFGAQYGWDPLPAEDEAEQAWDETAPAIDILIGHTSGEAEMFLPRKLGRVLSRPLVKLLTYVIYGRGSRRFARRHVRAGGRAHHYVISWSAPGSAWGPVHTIDLPLLFGDDGAWKDADLISGSTWAEVEPRAREVRAIWGSFARGEALKDRLTIDSLIDYWRVR